MKNDPIINEIKEIDLNKLSPIEDFNICKKIQNQLLGENEQAFLHLLLLPCWVYFSLFPALQIPLFRGRKREWNRDFSGGFFNSYCGHYAIFGYQTGRIPQRKKRKIA